MQVHNQTRFVHQMTMGMDVAGREFVSLVIKGSFAFPDQPGAAPGLLDPQRPLVMADEATGAPGFSATLWETDFAFRKARCDVVAQGAAHAPGGRPAERVRVGLRVGQWVKQFDVVGPRQWRVLGPAITATRPHPFTRQPFSYDTAFGGPDRARPDDPAPPVFADNPVGLGFATLSPGAQIDGLALPNTEAVDDPVTSPFGAHRPMALGPIGRAWPARARHAGTYDDHWKDNVFPFLPADFDERYYQMAPEDQQIDPPAPMTPVVVVGLTPAGREEFRLPETRLPVTLLRGRDIAHEAVLLPDTLIFDTEARVFMLVWRTWAPIRRTLAEWTEAWIGPPTPAMLRARAEGRDYLRAVATEEDAPEEPLP
ncbi:DUF2169 family type VI secretion system accessory protein [Gemmobacter caeruleus]|uniref:DUF2169 family type VI secretion system accessory protein n=1 Tax=Gemmobacter caeruleus TaxID=2595004 RepID=UPI0011ED32FF|nr:DUF2169 domain-containing protein [Gemmobacter caeruleus]